MKTTLNRIRAFSPSEQSWNKLLKALNKTKADDEPLSIITLLDIIGLDDTLLCLRSVEGHDREIRLLNVNYAERVRHLMVDPNSVNALEVSERYANGQATEEELNAARDTARVVAEDAVTWVAKAAAEAAARTAAARAAAWTAAWTALSAAAAAAAAGVGVTDWAAWDAERKYQADELRRFCTCIDSGIDPYPPKGI